MSSAIQTQQAGNGRHVCLRQTCLTRRSSRRLLVLVVGVISLVVVLAPRGYLTELQTAMADALGPGSNVSPGDSMSMSDSMGDVAMSDAMGGMPMRPPRTPIARP